MVAATLDRADFEPDVIAIYGLPAQVMRLAQSAVGGHDGTGTVKAVATGFGDCGDIITRTMLTGECHAVLPSGGDRVFASTQDHEFVFSMPWSKVEKVIEVLAATHKAGFRYPVITDIRHRPNLPPFLNIPQEA
jgi:uncharacterized protein (DUF169 family)